VTAHARFSASGAARWMACAASIKATEGVPDTSSPYALEGTVAHHLAEVCLRNHRDADTFLGEAFDIARSVTIDAEMVANVQEYLDYVRGLRGQLFIEQRVDYSHVVPGGFGTADALVVDGDTLYVVDLKYGQGLRVDVERNPQLQLYGVGAMHTLSWLSDITKVVLVVHQPRLDHVSEWETTPEGLAAFGETARKAAELALSDDPPYSPGPACRWCKLSGRCRAQAQYNLATARAEFGPPVDSATLTDDEVSDILFRLPAMRAWASKVEERALDTLTRGDDLPGWKLVEGRSLRQWADKETAAADLIEELGDDAWKRDLISPAQAEKALGKKHVLLERHVTKPPGKPTLAPEADKRKPFRLAEAQREFDQLPEEG